MTPTEDPAAANGIEIASREGNPVRALHSGTVSFAGPLAGFGNLVIVDHGDNTLSVYGYLGSMSVNRDDMVMSGARDWTCRVWRPLGRPPCSSRSGSTDAPSIPYNG